jgi:hypothetical protein
VNNGACAFCHTALDLDQPGSVWIVAGSERGPTRQELFAHAACIAEHLHPQTPFEATAFEEHDAD